IGARRREGFAPRRVPESGSDGRRLGGLHTRRGAPTVPRPVRPARSPLHLLSGARLSEPAEPSRVDHPDRVRGHTPDGLRRRRVGTGGDEVTSRLTLTRASLLTGTVKDGEGRPVSGAKILLSGRPSRARSGAR